MIHYSQNMQSLVQTVLSKYPALLDYIREKRYKHSDTGLTYRQVNSFDQSGLLKESRGSKKQWRNFSLNDLLYLHIISRARLFNTSNSQLRELRNMFYDQRLNYNNIGEISDSEIALIALLTGQIPVGLLIFSDGQAILTDDDSLSITLGYSDSQKRAFLFIMLYETFKPFISKAKNNKAFQSKFDLAEFDNSYSLKPIGKRQLTLLEAIEDGDYSDIKISKKVNGKLAITLSKTINSKNLTKADIGKLSEGKSFGSYKVTVHNNKSVSFRDEKIIHV